MAAKYPSVPDIWSKCGSRKAPNVLFPEEKGDPPAANVLFEPESREVGGGETRLTFENRNSAAGKGAIGTIFAIWPGGIVVSGRKTGFAASETRIPSKEQVVRLRQPSLCMDKGLRQVAIPAVGTECRVVAVAQPDERTLLIRQLNIGIKLHSGPTCTQRTPVLSMASWPDETYARSPSL